MHELKPPVNVKDKQTGNLNAKLTLIEYGDYECPYCGLAYPIIKKLLNERGDEIRFVFRNFPMQTIHPYSMVAALAAEAASQQGKFWLMHDLIYENQENFDNELFLKLARALKLDLTKFQSDINSTNSFSTVDGDFKSGLHSGVNGTPSFFINNFKIELPELTYDELVKVIDNTKAVTNKSYYL